MTAIQPQTIVIKTLPTKMPTTLTVNSQIEHDMLDDLYGDGSEPRKRRRLTHLSQEEKLLRRKLKNRVAAQTARDRKKNFMSELEQKVAALEQENRKLAEENKVLKSESSSLQQQNEELKNRLSHIDLAPGKSILGDKHNFGSKSNFVSLLQKCQSQIPDKEVSTVKVASLPGTFNNANHTTDADVVGPSTTELESFKELIQFDHVYFKPQPKGKTDSAGHTKIVSNPINSDLCVQTVAKGSGVENVNIIITSDGENSESVLKEEDYTNRPEMITNIEEDNAGFSSLLEDLEELIKADPAGLSCLENENSSSQISANGHIIESGMPRGVKRKASADDIKAIFDRLCDGLPRDNKLSVDCDYLSDVPSPSSERETSSPFSAQEVPSPLSTQEAIVDSLFDSLPPDHKVSVDSGYCSDVPSPSSGNETTSPSREAMSPCSTDVPSPFSDSSMSSPLSGDAWEESFTELFPSLM